MTRLFRSSLWYLVEKAFRLGGTFLLALWIARSLGPVQYGTLAYAMGIVAMLSFLASLGLESVVGRELAQRPQQADTIASTYFAVRLSGAALVPILAGGYVLLTADADPMLLAVAVVLGAGTLFTSMDVVDIQLQAAHLARTTSLVRIGAFLVGATCKVGLILWDCSLIWFAFANVLELLVAAIAFHLVARHRGLRIGLSFFDRRESQGLVAGGRYLIASALTVAVYSKVDILVLGQLLNREALANYAIAAMACSAWNIVGMSIAQSFAPFLSIARQANAPDYARLLRRCLLTMAAVALAGSLILSAAVVPVFEVVMGDRFVLAAQVFSVLVWASVPTYLGIATSLMIVNERLYFLSLLRTTAAMVFMLACIVPVAQQFGAIGVAWLVIVNSALATGTILLAPRVRTQLRAVLLPLAAAT